MIDPARVLVLARRVASDHHPRWRDTAESAAAEHLWRAALRWDGRGSCEAWACQVARLRARSAVAAEMARSSRMVAFDAWSDPAAGCGDDPEARTVARSEVEALAADPGLARIAGARVAGAGWAQAGAAVGVSGQTAWHRLWRYVNPIAA